MPHLQFINQYNGRKVPWTDDSAMMRGWKLGVCKARGQAGAAGPQQKGKQGR
jgi:hypothetical protein